MRYFFIIFVLIGLSGINYSVTASSINGLPYISKTLVHNLNIDAMNTKEIWKEIEGYEGMYQISNLGRVKSLKREVIRGNGRVKPINERVLKHSNRSGYKLVVLSKGKVYSCYIHRLVASAFISNPQNKPHVNHKNGIKTDNSPDNLEWVTPAENLAHAFKTGLMKRPKAWLGKKGRDNPNSKPILQLDLDGNIIAEYAGAAEARRILGFGRHVSSVCNGKRRTAHGYKWKWKNS